MSLSDRLQAARNQRPAGQSYVAPPEPTLPASFYDDAPGFDVPVPTSRPAADLDAEGPHHR